MDLFLPLEAISFAARKHAGQIRKDGRTPYFAHPARVLFVLAREFGVTDPEVLAAAVLHDTIEDTTVDRDELSSRFGERVAAIVASLTKDKRLPEEAREDAYFDALARAGAEVKLCKLADALDNLIDSRKLPAPFRRKTATRAWRLVEALAPGFPGEWAHALERVRREIAAVEESLGDAGRE